MKISLNDRNLLPLKNDLTDQDADKMATHTVIYRNLKGTSSGRHGKLFYAHHELKFYLCIHLFNFIYPTSEGKHLMKRSYCEWGGGYG